MGELSRWLTLRSSVRFWPVIQNMVVQELRVRYHRSVLGFLWTLVNPILMMLTLTVVFSQLMQQDAQQLRHLPVRWHGALDLFSSTITDCAFCIIANENLIRKIYLPKLVFPVSRLLINLVTFVLSDGSHVPDAGTAGSSLLLGHAAAAGGHSAFATFALGLGLIVATSNTFFRDCSPPGRRLPAGLVLRDADHLRDQPDVARHSVAVLAQPRLSVHPHVPGDHQRGPMARSGDLCVSPSGSPSRFWELGYATFKTHEDKLIFRL